MRKTIIFLLLLAFTYTAQSQILLSLIFGDKLNSEYIEFGLEGGANFSTISNLDHDKTNIGFNLGFYFDFKFKENPNWMVNTGVIIKSPMGADKIPVYSLDNEVLDNAFEGGYVNRKLRYFNVPILAKYKFDNNIYVKAGPMLGLRSKAFDEFNKEIDGDDLQYKNNIKERVHTVDAGAAIGAGYHLMKGHGMNIGVMYYLGMVPVMKGDAPKQYNRSFYITACIPIGKGKAEKKSS